jgi:hypothetical protein
MGIKMAIIINGDSPRAIKVFLNKIAQSDNERPITTMSCQLFKSTFFLNFLKKNLKVLKITNATTNIASEHIIVPPTTRKTF